MALAQPVGLGASPWRMSGKAAHVSSAGVLLKDAQDIVRSSQCRPPRVVTFGRHIAVNDAAAQGRQIRALVLLVQRQQLSVSIGAVGDTVSLYSS